MSAASGITIIEFAGRQNMVQEAPKGAFRSPAIHSAIGVLGFFG